MCVCMRNYWPLISLICFTDIINNNVKTKWMKMKTKLLITIEKKIEINLSVDAIRIYNLK